MRHRGASPGRSKANVDRFGGRRRFVAFFGQAADAKFTKPLKPLRRIHYRDDETPQGPQIGLRPPLLKDNDCTTASGRLRQKPDDSGCPVGVVVSRGAWLDF